MGLSVMADAPDVDQRMRFANIAGQMQTITPHQWVGESTMHGLGFEGNDAAGNVVQDPWYQGNLNPNVAAGLSLVDKIANIVQQNKANKRNKNAQRPAPQVNPMVTTSGDTGGGGMDMSKLLLYGGIAVAGVIVIMMIMKKKKNAGGE